MNTSRINIFNKKFYLLILGLAFLDVFSFFVFYLPALHFYVFFLILALAFILSMWKIEYGMYFVLIDILLGSKSGAWFSFSYDQFYITIRIALFIVIFSVCTYQTIRRYKEINIREALVKLLFVLMLAVGWGIAQGVVQKNSFQNIFFDANGYFFLFYFLLFHLSLNQQRIFQNVIKIIGACAIIMSIQTIVILLFYSFNFQFIIPAIYHWIRDTGLGEITPVAGNFYRVFFQGQIYCLISLFIFLPVLIYNYNFLDKIQRRWLYLIIFLSSFTVLLSFSRSYWVGFLMALLVFFVVIKYVSKFSWKKISVIMGLLVLVILFQVCLVYALIRAPIGGLLSQRIANVSESAASSRMNQLQPLFTEILKHPIAGSGFGTLLTFITNDPRTRSVDPQGRLTTFAFEWGYLDILLKIGIIGLGIYCWFLFMIYHRAWKIFQSNIDITVKSIVLGFLLALTSLLVTHMFSPYINHPLGICFIILFVQYIIFITPHFSIHKKNTQ